MCSARNSLSVLYRPDMTSDCHQKALPVFRFRRQGRAAGQEWPRRGGGTADRQEVRRSKDSGERHSHSPLASGRRKMPVGGDVGGGHWYRLRTRWRILRGPERTERPQCHQSMSLPSSSYRETRKTGARIFRRARLETRLGRRRPLLVPVCP